MLQRYTTMTGAGCRQEPFSVMPDLLTTLSPSTEMSLKEYYPVIDHVGEAPIMSSKPNLHVKFCVLTNKVVTALRINLPDVEELTLEVPPSLDHLSLPHGPGHLTGVSTVLAGHHPHTLRLLLLPPVAALEQLVGDEEGGEAPDEEAGAEHHPPPAGQHHDQ